MKKLLLVLLCGIGIYQTALAQPDSEIGSKKPKTDPAIVKPDGVDEVSKDDGTASEDEDPDNQLITQFGALMNYNFVGNNKFLSNITPIIRYGGEKPLYTSPKKHFQWSLDMHLYAGADIETKDSSSFVPALMLYGRGGLNMNNYFYFNIGKNTEKPTARIILFPACFTIKMLPNIQDSQTIIVQHNLRTGFAFQLDNLFMLGFQYTHAWHNMTSESRKQYEKVFGTTTDIDYITATLQYAPQNVNNLHIYLEWRSLLSTGRYGGFDNISVLTAGVRKEIMNVRNAAPGKAAAAPAAGARADEYKPDNSIFLKRTQHITM